VDGEKGSPQQTEEFVAPVRQPADREFAVTDEGGQVAELPGHQGGDRSDKQERYHQYRQALVTPKHVGQGGAGDHRQHCAEHNQDGQVRAQLVEGAQRQADQQTVEDENRGARICKPKQARCCEANKRGEQAGSADIGVGEGAGQQQCAGRGAVQEKQRRISPGGIGQVLSRGCQRARGRHLP
jgi:hypothetical protein